MNIKKILSIVLSGMLVFGLTINASDEGAYYFPGVTRDMSISSYWANEDDILMSFDEIEALNEMTISAKGTNMYDLKNQPETFNGVALNEAIERSSRADAAYYLGWTYLESKEKATMDDYEKIIENTKNPNASEEQSTLYGIAVKRTNLRTFPSEIAIWDDPADLDFDYQCLSTVRVNEPLVITSVSADGKYYLAKNICCSGWIPSEDVAICKDKEEWLSAWDFAPGDTLLVWGDKVFTEYSVMAKENSHLMLTMGTTLELVRDIDPNELVDNRAAYNNYVVCLPIRNEDGSYAKKQTLISEHHKVSVGYLPLTKKNISKVAFAMLGNTYGWGGSLYSDDCSGYMRNIYKCFGLELARNTVWQEAMPMAKTNMRGMCREERIDTLSSLPFGTILYFNGHEMMYLGEENGIYYVISSVSSMMRPGDSEVRQRVRSVVVNSLMIKRANGNTWMDELVCALVPYMGSEAELPGYQWYHDGMAYSVENGIMALDEEKQFNPDLEFTWGEAATFLYKAEELKAEEAIALAIEAGIINDSMGEIKAEDPVKREALICLLYTFAKNKGMDVSVGEDTNILSYEDSFEISEYAVPAMQYALGCGIIMGRGEGILAPSEYATRAESALIFKNFIEETEAKGWGTVFIPATEKE